MVDEQVFPNCGLTLALSLLGGNLWWQPGETVLRLSGIIAKQGIGVTTQGRHYSFLPATVRITHHLDQAQKIAVDNWTEDATT